MDGTQTDGRVANVRAVALARELAALDANDCNIIGISLFELPQLRKNVDTVDSAVGPEIEQEELAAKIGELKPAAAGVDPVERVREIGRAYGGTIH